MTRRRRLGRFPAGFRPPEAACTRPVRFAFPRLTQAPGLRRGTGTHPRRRRRAPADHADRWIQAEPWSELLGEEDRATLERARFGRRVGMGLRPALLVIDVQNYMLGPPEGPNDDWPSATPAAHAAVARLAPLLAAARDAAAPVVYTQFVFARDGGDMGVYARKRDRLDIEGWCLEGSAGAEIAPQVAPALGDLVLVKKRPSAFFGTPLLGLLRERAIDTVIVTGGSTSNCVRATVLDAASHDFRTLVVADCVFDRFPLSHRVSLFDLDRQFADVVSSAEVIKQLRSR